MNGRTIIQQITRFDHLLTEYVIRWYRIHRGIMSTYKDTHLIGTLLLIYLKELINLIRHPWGVGEQVRHIGTERLFSKLSRNK